VSLLLAIETATIEVSVAILGDDGPVGSFSARGTRLQVETVHPAIDGLLRALGLEIAGIGAVVVDVGPGRFTGLRVGVAAAKAFAYARAIPLATVTSTEVLAAGAALDPGPVVPVIDMRRGEVAFSLPVGTGARAIATELGTPEAFGRRLGRSELDSPLLVGDGALRYRQAIEAAASVPLRFASDEHAAPRAEVLARLGRERLARNEAMDPFAVLPLYLRGVDVRIGWETREPAGALRNEQR